MASTYNEMAPTNNMDATAKGERLRALRAHIDYFRDLGVQEFYRKGEAVYVDAAAVDTAPLVETAAEEVDALLPTVHAVVDGTHTPAPSSLSQAAPRAGAAAPADTSLTQEIHIPVPVGFDQLAPLPAQSVPPDQRAAALRVIQEEIGDCTRCPLAYAGRHKIVFGDGDPNAELMFVGEGPGADEDEQGLPFVGKGGQLLNNMIAAMGLKREQVYIANIVKCRPPQNRVPEPVEANTCTPFLLRQMDTVRPKVVVALGATAATYLLGRKTSLSSLRGMWHSVRGAKLAVTYHPAYLLRDPRQKGEAWKDLQMVMAELGLKTPGK